MIEWLQCGEYCNGKACQAAKEARFEKLKAERKRIREEQDGPDDEARTETDIDEYDDWGLVCHHSLALDIDLFALAGMSLADVFQKKIMLTPCRLLRYRRTSCPDRYDTTAKDRAPAPNGRMGHPAHSELGDIR